MHHRPDAHAHGHNGHHYQHMVHRMPGFIVKTTPSGDMYLRVACYQHVHCITVGLDGRLQGYDAACAPIGMAPLTFEDIDGLNAARHPAAPAFQSITAHCYMTPAFASAIRCITFPAEASGAVAHLQLAPPGVPDKAWPTLALPLVPPDNSGTLLAHVHALADGGGGSAAGSAATTPLLPLPQ